MKHKRDYGIVAFIVVLIFVILFLSKGIYPFGTHSLIWGDMQDQITAFFYHLYDSFLGDASIWVDFTTSGSINFFGIFTYYLASPINFLILLFPRDNIYQAISIIIAVKVLLASLTCLYAIRTTFPKTPSYIAILLAICYAFSGYAIVMYQITAWMDIVYLFPILWLGLKKVLDGEKPYLYIVTLTLSFILCFYLAILMLLFIFFLALPYLWFFHREDMKKSLVGLGVGTLLSVLLSAVVLVPSYIQISESSRMAFDINELLNSKFSMIGDKVMLFCTTGVLLGCVIYFLVRDYKASKNHTFFWYVISSSVIFLVPVLIEPVNKMFHLGSYALFPLRTFFLFYFFLILIFLHYFGEYQPAIVKKKTSIIEVLQKSVTKKQVVAFIFTVLFSIVIILTIHFNYSYFQHTVYNITTGSHWKVPLIALLLILGTVFFTILLCVTSKKKFSYLTIGGFYLLAVTNILCWSFVYYGMDFAYESMDQEFASMTELSHAHEEDDVFRVKSNVSNFVQNYGMITQYPTLDHFTSVTNGTNMETLRRLGYTSYWVKTYSSGGTLFSDALLGNKYLITEDRIDDENYQYVDTFGTIHLYESQNPVQYGYIVQGNTSFTDVSNAFESQNLLYRAVTGKEEDLFSVYEDDFRSENLHITTEDDLTSYEIVDDELLSMLHTAVEVKDRSVLYLDVLKSMDNTVNAAIMGTMNIYVNGVLLIDDYPREMQNGLLELGTFENETVDIDIQIISDVSVRTLKIGAMSYDKYLDFARSSVSVTDVSTHKNQITIETDAEVLLFLPITYHEGYTLEVDGVPTDIEVLFDNYIGVSLSGGEHTLTLTYHSPGVKAGLLISIVTFLFCLFLFTTPLYENLASNFVTQQIVYYGYLALYFILTVAFFIVPILGFIISFFYRFHL